MLHQYLLDEQFEQSLVDPCVYTRIKDESKVTIIVWVDDITVALSTREAEYLHGVSSSYARSQISQTAIR